jgi:protein-S-isoprenylcysteine O-methyltransferase Ste14
MKIGARKKTTQSILLLIINNYRYWFENPFSSNQIISWIFLIYSLILLIPGILLMNKLGNPLSDAKRDELYKFEKTTKLINTGIFKFVRHPLYGSLLFLTWGILFKNISIVLLTVSIMSSVFLFITANIEEKEDIAFFGQRYIDYMKRTKMFIPYIF